MNANVTPAICFTLFVGDRNSMTSPDCHWVVASCDRSTPLARETERVQLPLAEQLELLTISWILRVREATPETDAFPSLPPWISRVTILSGAIIRNSGTSGHPIPRQITQLLEIAMKEFQFRSRIDSNYFGGALLYDGEIVNAICSVTHEALRTRRSYLPEACRILCLIFRLSQNTLIRFLEISTVTSALALLPIISTCAELLECSVHALQDSLGGIHERSTRTLQCSRELPGLVENIAGSFHVRTIGGALLYLGSLPCDATVLFTVSQTSCRWMSLGAGVISAASQVLFQPQNPDELSAIAVK